MTRFLICGKPRERLFRTVVGAIAAAGGSCRFFWPATIGLATTSRAAYLAQFSDDLDFAAVGVAKAFSRRAFGARAHLDLHSRFYGRLRKIAAEIDRFRPDFVLIHSGFRPLAQIAVAKAMSAKAPVLFVDGGFAGKGAFILDPRAPVAASDDNSLSVEWNDAPLSAADKNRAEDFIVDFRRGRETKIAAPATAAETRRIEQFIARDSRPILLLAMQAFDFNTAIALPAAFGGDYGKWTSAILAAIPADWKVVIKKHPSGAAWFAPALGGENQILADRVDLRDLIKRCSAVISLSSNVGLEAALAGKPAIVCGRSHYGGRGVALDLAADGDSYAASLPVALRQAREYRPSDDALARYVCRVILDYQIWPGETVKFKERLEIARQPAAAVGDARRPFFDSFPAALRAYAESVNELAALQAFSYSAAARVVHWLRRQTRAAGRAAQKGLK